MEYPTYSPHDEPAESLAAAYMASVGDDFEQSSWRSSVPYQYNAASASIGRLCSSVITRSAGQQKLAGTKPGDRLQLEASLNALDALDIKRPGEPIEKLLLHTAADIVTSPGSQKTLDAAREAVHRNGIDMLRLSEAELLAVQQHGRVELLKGSGRLLGVVAHYTVLGLLSRLCHPRLLALPALPHQDFGMLSKADNFDICLIESTQSNTTKERRLESSGGSNTAITHRLQVKSKCFGSCGQSDNGLLYYAQTEDRLVPTHPIFQSVAAHYSPLITLVSGCCDAGMHYDSRNVTTTTAKMLIAEMDGIASGADVEQLDLFTNNLLLTITGNQHRRGTEGMPSVAIKRYGTKRHADTKKELQPSKAAAALRYIHDRTVSLRVTD